MLPIEKNLCLKKRMIDPSSFRMSQFIYSVLIVASMCVISSCGGCNNGIVTPTQPTPENLCNNLKKDSLEVGIDCGGPCIPCNVISEKELIIIDNSVVDHIEAKSGKLSFSHLITTMAGNNDPGLLVKSLFQNWRQDFNLQGSNSIAPARLGVEDFLEKWKTIDGDPNSIDDWIPNIENAPFRLLGITNRLDLKDTLIGSAGEGRFTYCAFDPTTPDSSKLTFNVIFEYNLIGNNRQDCSRWVNEWHKLSILDIDDEEYIDSLISVTEIFVQDNDLNQLRTNDFEFEQVWELREFLHDHNLNSFVPNFLSKTPDISFNGSSILETAVSNLSNEIQNNLPYEFNPSMRAASAVPNTAPPGTINNPSFTWNVPSVDPALEEITSLKTCNGCHMGLGQNQNIPFLHMAPRDRNAPVEISGRLDGIDRDFRIHNMETLLELPVPRFAASLTDSLSSERLRAFIQGHIGH